MSKSFKEYKKVKLQERVKSILENWNKNLIIFIVSTILIIGISTLTYSAWEGMTTYKEYVNHERVEKVVSVKKSQFILYISIISLSVFISIMYSSIEEKWLGNIKDNLYLISSQTLRITLITGLSLTLLYYIGSFFTPLIFG